MTDMWGGGLHAARGFYVDKIHPRREIWPSWLNELIEESSPRFCPSCARLGYHSVFHQIATVEECPLHGERLLDTCLSCGDQRPVLVDTQAARPRCRSCGWSPFPDLARKFERSDRFLDEEKSAFNGLARAIAHCGMVSVTEMKTVADCFTLTSKPKVHELVLALGSTRRLPMSSVRHLLGDASCEIDAIIEPFCAHSRRNSVAVANSSWRRINRIISKSGAHSAAIDCFLRGPRALEAGLYMQALMSDVAGRDGQDFRPPSSDAYWALVLRALAADWDRRPMSPSCWNSRSLRHRMAIQRDGRPPEWLVLRACCLGR
jgi:hypothetical protein